MPFFFSQDPKNTQGKCAPRVSKNRFFVQNKETNKPEKNKIYGYVGKNCRPPINVPIQKRHAFGEIFSKWFFPPPVSPRFFFTEILAL